MRLPDFDPADREPDTWLPQPEVKNEHLGLVSKVTQNVMFYLYMFHRDGDALLKYLLDGHSV